MLTFQPQLPPGRWIRIPAAAAYCGTSRDLLLAEIQAGRLPCRVRHLGRRGILHVFSDDVTAAAVTLNGAPTASTESTQ